MSCPACEILWRSGFALRSFHKCRGMWGLVAIRWGSGSWGAWWWMRGQTVSAVVSGQRLFEVIRPCPTPLAGDVFQAGLLSVMCWLCIVALPSLSDGLATSFSCCLLSPELPVDRCRCFPLGTLSSFSLIVCCQRYPMCDCSESL